MGAVSLISAIYFLYFQCISILSYNPNQSNANFNIEKKKTCCSRQLTSETTERSPRMGTKSGHRCNRRNPLQIGTHKHCYHVINDINCVQNLMLMYVQQAESPPNEIRSLKICHHPILGLQLMQWLQ